MQGKPEEYKRPNDISLDLVDVKLSTHKYTNILPFKMCFSSLLIPPSTATKTRSSTMAASALWWPDPAQITEAQQFSGRSNVGERFTQCRWHSGSTA